MARLNQISVDSDDEFPDLSTLLQSLGNGDIPASERVLQKRDGSGELILPRSPEENHSGGSLLPLRPLKPADINALRVPALGERHDGDDDDDETKVDIENVCTTRKSPRRTAEARVGYQRWASGVLDTGLLFNTEDGDDDDDDESTDLSGFIVPDSASEEEGLGSGSRTGKGSATMMGRRTEKYVFDSVRLDVEEGERTGVIDRTRSRKGETMLCPESPPRFRTPSRVSDGAEQCSDPDQPLSTMRFSPPRSKSPYKRKDASDIITPPSSPSRARLQSPSKGHRIPQSPHRPSIDAFWSADVINDWNEQFSPKKALKSPRKLRLHSVEEDKKESSPSESPRRSPNKSPAKMDRKLIDARKAFDERKKQLAASFVAEVDLAVGDGQVGTMAESTGGIKIVWSKKLSSTAGRANWRREAVRSESTDGAVSTIIHRHHASIELAEKVIDDEDRLNNVIAHEYCHLANFMISGIKDNPHGASFKTWAAKTSRAFKGRNINVTTKHTYEIAYKYIWVCASPTCGVEYKRHSKSIDPAKHSCGSCKSKLLQVQPAPRKGCASGEGKRNDYQEYVKREHEGVRARNPGAGFGEIMAILGREYRESKKPALVVEHVGERPKSLENDVDSFGGDLDDVASKLGFLDLEG